MKCASIRSRSTWSTRWLPRIGRAPHIFIFVIDSLRQDYLSPYNPGVTFTPAIDAFARDSVVFKRAFTQYGATGLSEPSIWVGGLLVHKQYVMPFAPMNALHKLLAADGYQRFISRDTILRTFCRADEHGRGARCRRPEHVRTTCAGR